MTVFAVLLLVALLVVCVWAWAVSFMRLDRRRAATARAIEESLARPTAALGEADARLDAADRLRRAPGGAL